MLEFWIPCHHNFTWNWGDTLIILGSQSATFQWLAIGQDWWKHRRYALVDTQRLRQEEKLPFYIPAHIDVHARLGWWFGPHQPPYSPPCVLLPTTNFRGLKIKSTKRLFWWHGTNQTIPLESYSFQKMNFMFFEVL